MMFVSFNSNTTNATSCLILNLICIVDKTI